MPVDSEPVVSVVILKNDCRTLMSLLWPPLVLSLKKRSVVPWMLPRVAGNSSSSLQYLFQYAD
jgi:hypothetical protein